MSDPTHDQAAWRTFRRFWASTAASNLADGMLLSATPLVALTLTRDPLAITTVTAMQYLPWLLFSVPLGTLADRVDRMVLLRIASTTRALGVGLLALALATGHVHILMLYALSFLFGLAETLYDTTSSALVPTLVEDHQLERANGRLYATQTVANSFAGPPLGGGLFALAVAAPFALGSAGYAVAALLLTVLPLTHSKRTPGKAPTTFVKDLKAGVRGFTGSPLLISLCVLFGIGNLASSAAYGLVALTVVERLDASPATFGLVLAGGAVGAFLGGTYGDRIGRLTRPGTTLLWTTVVSGLVTAAIGLADHLIVLSALMAVDGFVVLTQSVIGVSLRARLIPDHMLGRVTAVFRTLSTGASALGAVLGGLLARALGLFWPFIIVGAVVVALGPILFRWLSNDRIEATLSTQQTTEEKV
ncbi:MFS transporter [Streptomyces sp. NPDC013953]|uniref:MFS transporter n=1 Tax=Streptomyces sp. NPDC013953 TaxID=3364868 RepID=UPI0036F59741